MTSPVIDRIDPGFLIRIPGRDHRKEITHKQVGDMNRHERRLIAKDALKRPERYPWKKK